RFFLSVGCRRYEPALLGLDLIVQARRFFRSRGSGSRPRVKALNSTPSALHKASKVSQCGPVVPLSKKVTAWRDIPARRANSAFVKPAARRSSRRLAAKHWALLRGDSAATPLARALRKGWPRLPGTAAHSRS